jgi:hypothetical protein
MKLKAALFLCAAFVALSSLVFAQDGPAHRFTFNVGAGPTVPVGVMNNKLNTGWNINAGAGVNLSNPFAIIAEFGYNNLGVSDQALAALNVPDGTTRIYSVTIDPMIRFGYGHRVGGYVIFGGGWYRRTVEFTRPTTAIVPFFDPWFGFFGTAIIPANQVLGSFTNDAGGANAGAGITIGVPHGAKFYAEARYHYINAGRHKTTILPITFGIRF